MKIKVILFDIDGTLVLLPIDWDRIVARIRSIPGVKAKTFLGFVSRYHGTEIFWYIHRILEELEINAVSRMIILDNSDALLRSLCRDIPIGFITMQSASAARKILTRLGLGDCDNNLGVLASREDAANRVEQLSKAIKKLNIDSRDILFIGDKILDAIAAVVNGVNSIVVLRNAMSMRISDTDFIDEDLEALGVSIAKNLSEAIRIAREVYGVPVEVG